MAEAILVERREASASAVVTLNRPRVHNALNGRLVAALAREFERLERDPAVRAVVLRANGRSFCAGADLGWMRRMAQAPREVNRRDAARLGELLRRLDGLSKPTLALVQGAAFGGGVGLAACCDIVLASETASFCLSEVRLGLIPAVIGPYILAALGERAARRYMLTGERFDAEEARRLALVHEVVPEARLEQRGAEVLSELAKGAPGAQAQAKALIVNLRRRPLDDALVDETAVRMANVRASDEAREGLSAFLEKRPPSWRRS